MSGNNGQDAVREKFKMLNRRGIIVLAWLATLFAAFYISQAEARPNVHGTRHHAARVAVHLVPARAEVFDHATGGLSNATYATPTMVRGPLQHISRNAGSQATGMVARSEKRKPEAHAARFADGIGPRPRKWCGWWMQHKTGITSAATGLNLNRAFDWRRVGSPGDGSPGNVLVGGSGRSHVSLIIARDGPNCYRTVSGNSGSPYPIANELRECGGTPRSLTNIRYAGSQ